MKKTTYFLLFIAGVMHLLLASCGGKPTEESVKTAEEVVLTLENTLTTPRVDAPFAFERSSLEAVLGEIPAGMVLKAADEAGKEVPSQTDDLDLDGQWDEWALVYSLPATAKAALKIEVVSPDALAAYPQRTAVHLGRLPSQDDTLREVTRAAFGKQLLPYQANQMDGPAWENELVGYRLYFDGRNARDVFGKREPAMVLHTVGKSQEGKPVDNYHVLEPWGRDVLSVGTSVGAGGLGLEEDGTLYRLGVPQGVLEDVVDSSVYQQISEGPVRSIFSVNYYGWEVNGNRYDVKNTISIWAGKYYYQNQVTLEGSFEGKKNLVTGFVNSNNDNPLTFEENLNGFVMMATHDKQTYEKEYFLGLAMLLPQSHFNGHDVTPDEGAAINTTFFAKLAVESGEPVTYRVFSGWELQDQNFTDSEFFFNMVREEAKQLGTPVVVAFEKNAVEN